MTRKPHTTALLLPGFGGTSEQPILVALEQALRPLRIRCVRLTPPRFALTPELDAYVGWLDEQRVAERATVLVGRSFGGRLCIRASARVASVQACVVVGLPIRPPGKPRPLDEAALTASPCPTLIIQGDRDELGPLPVVRACARKNSNLSVHVVEGASHSLRASHQRVAVAASAEWLAAQLHSQ